MHKNAKPRNHNAFSITIYFWLQTSLKMSAAVDTDTKVALQTAANEARGLAMDSIAAAKSGHMGLPLGAAEIGATLYGSIMQYNAKDLQWMNHDRFIFSAGR